MGQGIETVGSWAQRVQQWDFMLQIRKISVSQGWVVVWGHLKSLRNSIYLFLMIQLRAILTPISFKIQDLWFKIPKIRQNNWWKRNRTTQCLRTYQKKNQTRRLEVFNREASISWQKKRQNRKCLSLIYQVWAQALEPKQPIGKSSLRFFRMYLTHLGQITSMSKRILASSQNLSRIKAHTITLNKRGFRGPWWMHILRPPPKMITRTSRFWSHRPNHLSILIYSRSVPMLISIQTLIVTSIDSIILISPRLQCAPSTKNRGTLTSIRWCPGQMSFSLSN